MKSQSQTRGRGVMIDRGWTHLERDRVSAPRLRTHVTNFCACTGDQIVHATGESGRATIARAKMLDHGDLCELVCDQKQMRKDRHVVVAQPMEDFDWLLDLDPTRNEEKCAV